jgi:hypothetical protein
VPVVADPTFVGVVELTVVELTVVEPMVLEPVLWVWAGAGVEAGLGVCALQEHVTRMAKAKSAPDLKKNVLKTKDLETKVFFIREKPAG